jgi:hypothetical protein
MVHATVGIRARDGPAVRADSQDRMDHPIGTDYPPMIADELTAGLDPDIRRI